MSNETTSLADKLATEPMRAQVIADCQELIDAEVAAKSGLGGIAIKGAYKTVKAIKPRFITEVIDALLDDWLAKLEPHYAKWTGAGSGSFSEYLTARSDDVAEDLLVVTDEKAEGTRHTTVKKLYKKMRGSAKTNVAAAVPALSRALERRISELDAAGESPSESAGA